MRLVQPARLKPSLAQPIDRCRSRLAVWLRGGLPKDGHHGRLRSHPELEAPTRLASVSRQGRWDLHHEAALIAAGFEYQPVRRVEDMPDCFSRPICRLAMQLNDTASDAQRQRLLPFVTRLACAETTEIECKRASYIGLQTAGPYTFEKGLSILEHALVIGRKAEAVPPDAVKTRLLAVQTSAATATSIPDTPVFATMKSWFVKKHTAPADE